MTIACINPSLLISALQHEMWWLWKSGSSSRGRILVDILVSPQWSSICWALNWPCVLWILHTSAAAFSTTDSKCKWPWSFPCLQWWHAYHLWLVNPPKNNFTQITCKRNGINFNDVSQFGFKPGSLKKIGRGEPPRLHTFKAGNEKLLKSWKVKN